MVQHATPARFRRQQLATAVRHLLIGSALGAGCSIGALAAPGQVVQGQGNTYAADGATITGTGDNSPGIYVSDGASAALARSQLSADGSLSDGAKVYNGASLVLDATTVHTGGEGSYGIDADHGSSITANDVTVTTQGSLVQGYGLFHGSHAVVSEFGSTVKLGGNNTLTTEGDHANGLFAQTDSAASPALLEATGTTTIRTSGAYSAGAEAYLDGAKIDASGLDVRTEGFQSHGAAATGGEVVLRDSTLATGGANAHGLLATGATARLSATDTQASTTGDAAMGARAEQGAQVRLDNVRVDTAGGGAYGLDAIGAGTSLDASNVQVHTSGGEAGGSVAAGVVAEFGASASVSGGSTIRTEGERAVGALAQTGPDSATPTTLRLDGGDASLLIETQGQDASGVAACTLGSGSASSCVVDAASESAPTSGSLASVSVNNATVRTSGAGATGLRAYGDGASIDGAGVTVSTSGDAAPAAASIKGGTLALAGSTLATSGKDSPAILVQGGDAAHVDTVRLAGGSVNAQQAEAIAASGSTARIELSDGTTVGSGTDVLAHAKSGANGQASDLVIDASGGVRLTGDVVADAGSGADLALAGQSTLTGGASNARNFSIDADSRWDMTKSSDLASLELQGGTLQFAPTPAGGFKTLTVGTLGGSGGTIGMNTVLNEGGAATQSDLVHVTGDASGQHSLAIANQGGAGAQTVGDGIKVVQVDGSSASNNFGLSNSVQAGAYEYRLYQGGTESNENWYLRSEYKQPPDDGGDESGDGGGGGGNGDGGNGNGDGGNATPATPSYRPAVPAYALIPSLNMAYGFATLGRLHERAGDIHSLKKGGNLQGKDGLWARVGGDNLNAASGRFEADQHDYFVQFGKDWEVDRQADGGHSHAGAMVTLGNADSRFSDSARLIDPALDAHTGNVQTEAQSLGGYYTKYLADGTYFDGVGQVTRYSNKYSDITGVTGKQKGVGAAVSGEVGKPFQLMDNGLSIEPQAQLAYQYLNLEDFVDQVSSVTEDGQQALRGRIGLRLFRPNATLEGKPGAVTPYLTADVLHNFLSPATTYVGGTGFQSGLTRTWYELGAGFTGTVNKNGEFYGNLKYGHNLGGDSMRNVSANVGYRYTW